MVAHGGIALAGLISSLLTAIVVTVIARLTGFNIFTFSIWLVVPAGALLCGCAAASGYLLGAKALHRRPTVVLLMQMIAVAALMQLLTYWLEYRTSTVDGVAVSSVVPFTRYLDVVLTTMRLRASRVPGIDSGEVGALGYGLAAIQFVGFLAGGVAVYLYLKTEPTCATCGTYLRTLARKQDRFAELPALAAYYDGEFAHPVDSPAFAAHVGARHRRAKGERGGFTLVAKVLGCPGCGAQAVVERATMIRGSETKDVPGFKRLVPIPLGIDVASAYR